MGELFWNKIAGAVIALVLAVFLIGWVTEELFHSDVESGVYAYPVDMAALAGGGDTGDTPEVVYDLGLLLANADPSAGARVVRRCTSCHTLEQGGGALQGPNLYDIVGRSAAAVDGFSYSSAMVDYGQNWTYENLDNFIANPRSEISGTAMSFAGLRGDEDRANLLAYLSTLSDNPAAFPDPLPPVEAEAHGDDMMDDHGDMAPVEDMVSEGETTPADTEETAPAETEEQ